MSKQNYKARWQIVGAATAIGNVSFTAKSDSAAIREADNIARELNLTRTPRTLMRGSVLIEVLNTGISKEV